MHRASEQLSQTFRAFSAWWTILFWIIFCTLVTHCTSGPPPTSLPPSSSDLKVLGKTYLCQTKAQAESSWLQPSAQKSSWGTWSEYFQEMTLPEKYGQWVVFNQDDTLVGVITVFPHGISLDDYPTLRKTLSQLPPAREFYLTSSQLLEGQTPDSATLYRTGEANTTHQYFLRHQKEQDDNLIMAIFVLDPYERLLDGSHPRFLSYVHNPRSIEPGNSPSSSSSTQEEGLLGLQQFARGEIALFASCGTQLPNIARNAYQQAIRQGLSDPKQLAEAHHRLGLAFSELEQFSEAQSSIETALTIQPHAANILNSYGNILVKRKKNLQGIQAFEQALALQPAYPQARFNLANAFESINPKRAIQEYETYIVLAEDRPEETAKVATAKAKIKALQH